MTFPLATDSECNMTQLNFHSKAAAAHSLTDIYECVCVCVFGAANVVFEIEN